MQSVSRRNVDHVDSDERVVAFTVYTPCGRGDIDVEWRQHIGRGFARDPSGNAGARGGIGIARLPRYTRHRLGEVERVLAGA